MLATWVKTLYFSEPVPGVHIVGWRKENRAGKHNEGVGLVREVFQYVFLRSPFHDTLHYLNASWNRLIWVVLRNLSSTIIDTHYVNAATSLRGDVTEILECKVNLELRSLFSAFYHSQNAPVKLWRRYQGVLTRIGKIQQGAYYQCCTPIGWATTRLYVKAHL